MSSFSFLSSKLSDPAEWIDTHRGENPEFEKVIKGILDGLKRLHREFQAANLAYDKRRARFRVVKQ
jgi:hypothetical protein